MNIEDMDPKVRRAWPWSPGFVRQLLQQRSAPFRGSQLFFASDYSGEHKQNPFRVYAFVIADADHSPEWPKRCRRVRDTHLPDGRRMSFKNLNDVYRQRALVPFLEAAEYLTGHVVVVAVNKGLQRISTSVETLEFWNRLRPLRGRWDGKTFEQMVRVAQFFSLIVSAWCPSKGHISWITDEDSIVANADRLDDLQQVAARLTSVLAPKLPLGVFAMNTVAKTDGYPEFEDFVAIADLSAGAIGEIAGSEQYKRLRQQPRNPGRKGLTTKSEVIADWFWYRAGTLKKTCIIIDHAARGMSSIGELRFAGYEPAT